MAENKEPIDYVVTYLRNLKKCRTAFRQQKTPTGWVGDLYNEVDKTLTSMIRKGEKAGEAVLQEYPIWDWLKRIPGLNVGTGILLVKYIRPISRFDNPSKLIVYCGYAVRPICALCGKEYEYNQRNELIRHLAEEHGIKDKFDVFIVGRADTTRKSQLKPVLFNIMESFIKRKECFYREMYDMFKSEIMAKYAIREIPADEAVGKVCADPIGKIVTERMAKNRDTILVLEPVRRPATAAIGWILCEDVAGYKAGTVIKKEMSKKLGNVLVAPTKRGIDMQARRKVIKLFISHLWEVWRKLEGLPVVLPYPVKMGMHEYIPPPYWDDEEKKVI